MDQVHIRDVKNIYVRPGAIDDRSDSSQDALVVKVSADVGVEGHAEVDRTPLVAEAGNGAPASHVRARCLAASWSVAIRGSPNGSGI
jgi:hypothetical protein